MLLEFVKEMPKPETKLRLDIASLIGAVFFTWVILLLFPVSSFKWTAYNSLKQFANFLSQNLVKPKTCCSFFFFFFFQRDFFN